MVKIIAISDSHNKHGYIELPTGDILVHAGDVTMLGSLEEFARFANWWNGLDYQYKVIVAGNHDKIFATNRYVAESMLFDTIYLEDSLTKINGLTIYGSPWTPKFGNWSFMDNDNKLKNYWELIPNVDILVTHGPPYGILDITSGSNKHVGSKTLLRVVQKIIPKVHIYGHIHEGYGDTIICDTRFVNAAICDKDYEPNNKPIVIDL